MVVIKTCRAKSWLILLPIHPAWRAVGQSFNGAGRMQASVKSPCESERARVREYARTAEGTTGRKRQP
jgi:hypothetical protein